MARPRYLFRLILVLVLLVFGTRGSAQEEPPGPPSAPDAVRLFKLNRVTVVYPAGPGEDRETNRLSASLRAQFLATTYGVRATEAADDQLTGEQRSGNLLLLGWNNRLLGTETAPSPFERSASGLRFLDLEHRDPLADLMFFYRSPYNPKRFVFFWSRIDPEMDRFMILPIVGSNWAILRDFLVVRQGMFEGGSSWPPTRNPLAEADRTEGVLETHTTRQIRRTDHYDIYYVPSEDIERDLDVVAPAREVAIARAAAALGPVPQGFRIRLFLYFDEEDKKNLTGIADPAHSLPRQRELHMIRRIARTSSSHEEVHLLARQLLGPCYLTSLYEGLALSEDGVFGGKDLGLHAALLVEKGELPTLDDLLQEARARALPETIAFPSAGLLLTWLRATGSREALSRAYSLKEGSAENLARALGKPAASLDSSFKQWVGEHARAYQTDIAFLKELSAAQDRYRAADYAGVTAALERALKAKPDDPQTLFNLAAAQLRAGVYLRAEATLKHLLELPLSPKESHLRIFSYYQLGRVQDVQGHREDALALYRRVLELPDQHDAHRLAQEAMETPVTADHLD